MVQQFAYQTDTGRLASSSVGFGTLAAVSSVFVNDQYSYDLRGNVTAIIDGGKEPSGVASGVKECFLYDTRDRLIRAHTATITGTCATTTASTSTAAGTLAAYDTRWTFDDLGRTRTVRDMLAAATVTYNYATSRHAITSLTGAATAAYTYNPVGAMTTRNTTALGYDAMQRLTSYGSIDTNLYRASNQRLIRTSGTTRTLYVPGMDVTVSAGVRTITRTLTIDGTPYGTRTHTSGTTATMWNCTNPQHTLTCTTPAGSTSIPPRTRYSPYGTPRTTTTITNTDRGHLNQPHDPTGLTYLNNRYYDPTLGAFTSVDPLVAKTGTPYLYAAGNPTTFSDSSGLSSCGTHEGPDTTVCVNEYEDEPPTPTCPPYCRRTPEPPTSTRPTLPGPSRPTAPVEPTEGASGGPVNSQQYAQYNRERCEYYGCRPRPRGWADAIIAGAFVVVVGGTLCVMSGIVLCATAAAATGTSLAPAALDLANGGPGMPSLDDGPMIIASARRGAIPDAVPRNLVEQLALAEARSGGGVQIIADLADEARIIALYGEGEWVKMQFVLRGAYTNTTVHWIKNLTTGIEKEFKFK